VVIRDEWQSQEQMPKQVPLWGLRNLTGIAAMLRFCVEMRVRWGMQTSPFLALRLRTSGNAGMTQILLGVLAQHLALMTANRAFDDNFWSGSRRSVYIGWGHTSKLTAQATCCNMNRHGPDIKELFPGSKDRISMISMTGIDFLGFISIR
jgi:hypothetical protein